MVDALWAVYMDLMILTVHITEIHSRVFSEPYSDYHKLSSEIGFRTNYEEPLSRIKFVFV